ncbi:YkvA family protein [Sphingosinithalassobacter sp. LHW66-3]|uniref:YkvA family protein n=1 Tax=Sphingosinithalassobacter sp. LHW66-3 TaxID=3424718 RepID=UPI003D6C267B
MGPSLAHRIRVEAHAVWLAVRDRRTPLHARLFGLLIAAYALSPIDLIPDFVPILGLLDEAVLIPLGVWVFEKMVPPALLAEHRAHAERASDRPIAWGGILIVGALWALGAWAVWTAAVHLYD